MEQVPLRKVLIVDVDPSVRFVLARTCERAGISRLLGGDRTPAPATIVRPTRSLHARKPEPTVLAGRVRRVG